MTGRCVAHRVLVAAMIAIGSVGGVQAQQRLTLGDAIGLDPSRCLGCGACASGCPIPGTPGMEGFDPRTAIRLVAMGREAEVIASAFPWVCTTCGRCSHVCPMGIDLPAVFALLRGLAPRSSVPGGSGKRPRRPKKRDCNDEPEP